MAKIIQIMKKGQVAFPVLLTGASMMAGIFTWTYAQFSNVKAEAAETNQRVARLEEAISTIKTDNGEIKKDIKTLLQIVK